jgi:hypothetical protein
MEAQERLINELIVNKNITVSADNESGANLNGYSDNNGPYVANPLYQTYDVKTQQAQYRIWEKEPHGGVIGDIPSDHVPQELGHLSGVECRLHNMTNDQKYSQNNPVVHIQPKDAWQLIAESQLAFFVFIGKPIAAHHQKKWDGTESRNQPSD